MVGKAFFGLWKGDVESVRVLLLERRSGVEDTSLSKRVGSCEIIFSYRESSKPLEKDDLKKACGCGYPDIVVLHLGKGDPFSGFPESVKKIKTILVHDPEVKEHVHQGYLTCYKLTKDKLEILFSPHPREIPTDKKSEEYKLWCELCDVFMKRTEQDYAKFLMSGGPHFFVPCREALNADALAAHPPRRESAHRQGSSSTSCGTRKQNATTKKVAGDGDSRPSPDADRNGDGQPDPIPLFNQDEDNQPGPIRFIQDEDTTSSSKPSLPRSSSKRQRSQQAEESEEVKRQQLEEATRRTEAAKIEVEQKQQELAKLQSKLGRHEDLTVTLEQRENKRRELGFNKRDLFYIALTGGAGVGKSSLCNAIRGLTNVARDAAPVKHTQVEGDQCHQYTLGHRVYYDFPGFGTMDHSRYNAFDAAGLYAFDLVIVVWTSRFTDTDVSVIMNCLRNNTPVLMVRMQSDTLLNDGDAEENSSSGPPEAKKNEIRRTTNEYIKSNVKVHSESMSFVINQRSLCSHVKRIKSQRITKADKPDPYTMDESKFYETFITVSSVRH